MVERLQIALDDGAQRALIPLENKRQFLEVARDLLEKVHPVFCSNCLMAAAKALAVR